MAGMGIKTDTLVSHAPATASLDDQRTALADQSYPAPLFTLTTTGNPRPPTKRDTNVTCVPTPTNLAALQARPSQHM